MKFVISRENLLKPLNLVAGVVERRQTLPVLSNVLIQLEGSKLALTGTDLEVELIGRVELPTSGDDGEITVPARKLVDICKSLPDGCDISFQLIDQKVQISSGRSKFSLSTLAASDFPNIELDETQQAFNLNQFKLKNLIDQTGFAMAQQDVRYYLNGMLWELNQGEFKVVATDGHRLAMAGYGAVEANENRQAILPRKGVLELARLLGSEEDDIQVALGSTHMRASTAEFTFTSKLVDGKYPDYQRVLPLSPEKEVIAPREELRQAFSRVAILSNEKYRGIRLNFAENELLVAANNPEQEEAEESVVLDYTYDPLEIGFNVSYLLDVMGVITGDSVKLSLSDSNSSALVESSDDSSTAVYVVMPMKL